MRKLKLSGDAAGHRAVVFSLASEAPDRVCVPLSNWGREAGFRRSLDLQVEADFPLLIFSMSA